MELRFGQQKATDQKKAVQPDVPFRLPQAWEIDAWKKKKPQVDDRPQPTVEIDEYPPGYKPEERRRDDGERGVAIVDYVV